MRAGELTLNRRQKWETDVPLSLYGASWPSVSHSSENRANVIVS